MNQIKVMVAFGLASVALATAAVGSTTAQAAGGTYTVAQCHSLNRGHEATFADRVAYSVNSYCDDPGNENAIQVNSVGAADNGRAGEARWVVPGGGALAIVAASLEAKLRSDAGHKARILAADAAGLETKRIASGGAEATPFAAISAQFAPAAGVFTRLVCDIPAGCPQSTQAKAWVREVQLRVADYRDPTFVRLDGTLRGEGWLRGAHGLDVVAQDAGAGLDQIGATVNGAALEQAPGSCPGRIQGTNFSSRIVPCAAGGELRINADTAATPFRDGENALLVCAADFATNAVCDARTVLVDNTPPALAFTDAEDPQDPELIRASVGDPHSGVAGGGISLREAGTEEWTPLATQLASGELRARVDSKAYAPGQYELRAAAGDVAGNEAESVVRANGEPMVVTLPLREPVRLAASIRPGGAKRQTIPYGRDSRVGGRLLDAAGEPLANQTVLVEEYFGPGALIDRRRREVETDGRGRWRSKLPAGPSRTVTAVYAGSPQFLDRQRKAGRLAVRSAASFRTSRRAVRAGKAVRFSGRIGRRGARIPNGGKLIELQVREAAGRWNTVREAFRTNSRGRYRLRYRFGTFYARDAKFRFRVKVAREQQWPYKAPVRSPSRKVVVRAR